MAKKMTHLETLCLQMDLKMRPVQFFLAGWYLVLVALRMVENWFPVQGVPWVEHQLQISVAWTPALAF